MKPLPLPLPTELRPQILAINAGAIAKAYAPPNSISWVTLTDVPREFVGPLRSLGFEEFSPDPETIDEWIATWNNTPRGPLLRSMFRTDALPTQAHPFGCLCPECQDCCCCGTEYGRHSGEEHSFVSSGWYAVSRDR